MLSLKRADALSVGGRTDARARPRSKACPMSRSGQFLHANLALALVGPLCVGALASPARAASTPAARPPLSPEVEVDIRVTGREEFDETLLLDGARPVDVVGDGARAVGRLAVGYRVALARGSIGEVVGLRAATPAPNHERTSLDAARVVGRSKRIAHRFTVVRAGADAIEATPDHLFYVAERGWVPAASLAPGDHLQGMAGEQVPVLDVHSEETAPRPIFNSHTPVIGDYAFSNT